MLNLHSRGWVSAFLCVDCKWCNVRNLFADKNSNFIPWFWLQSQWQWGWGESGVSSLYLPPNYGHNNVHQALLSQPIRGQNLRFYWPMTRLEEYKMNEGWGVSIESQGSTKCYLMSCDHQIDIWEARFERKPEHKVYNRRAEQSRKWAILRGFYMGQWMKHLVQKYTITHRYKISTSILLPRFTNMWWVRNQVWGCQEDVRMTCH